MRSIVRRGLAAGVGVSVVLLKLGTATPALAITAMQQRQLDAELACEKALEVNTPEALRTS